MHDYSIDLRGMQGQKRRSLYLADCYDALADRVAGPLGAGAVYRKRAAMCRGCGTYLKYGILEGGGNKLVDANFCRQRLCPMCAFRRSHRSYADISKVLDWVSEVYPQYQYLFLTLTVRNVEGDKLGQVLDDMAKGFKRLIDADGKRRRFRGIIRTTEVTVSKRYNTYHPHYHLILAVPPEYFDRSQGLYWTTSDWAAAWQQCIRSDYTPITDIRAIKGRKNAVKETSKYAVKPASLFAGRVRDQVLERILYLQNGLHSRRLLSYTGCFGEARRALGLSEHDLSMDLTDKIEREDVFEAFVTYHWGFGARCYDIVKE